MAISATSGLVSSIDYQSLIEQLVAVRREPITALYRTKDFQKSVSSEYGKLASYLDAFKAAADALRTVPRFSVFTAASSNDEIVTATAGSGASAGSYQIVVESLASAHKTAADGVESSGSVISSADGVFEFEVGGGEVQSVAITSTTTLAELKSAINSLNAGVTATIVNDGTASPARLVLTSSSTGASNAINITQNETALAFSTTLQTPQDASLTIDGMAITSASNTLTEAIEGVTLDIESADGTKTVTVNVGRDAEAISAKVSDLVDKYNKIVGLIRANSGYNSDTKAGGAFFGDSVARTVLTDLQKLLVSAVPGLPDSMSRLTSVGIKTGEGGLLSLDTARLNAALAADYEGVVNLFADNGTTSGIADRLYDKINEFISDDGRITARKRGIEKQIKSLDKNIDYKEMELARYEDMIRSQFTALESMLAQLNSQSKYLTALVSTSQSGGGK